MGSILGTTLFFLSAKCQAKSLSKLAFSETLDWVKFWLVSVDGSLCRSSCPEKVFFSQPKVLLKRPEKIMLTKKTVPRKSVGSSSH